MNLSDNTISAFLSGVSTIQEDLLVLNEMTHDAMFNEFLDEAKSLDSLQEISEMRDEFNMAIDKYEDYKELKTKIK